MKPAIVETTTVFWELETAPLDTLNTLVCPPLGHITRVKEEQSCVGSGGRAAGVRGGVEEARGCVARLPAGLLLATSTGNCVRSAGVVEECRNVGYTEFQPSPPPPPAGEFKSLVMIILPARLQCSFSCL